MENGIVMRSCPGSITGNLIPCILVIVSGMGMSLGSFSGFLINSKLIAGKWIVDVLTLPNGLKMPLSRREDKIKTW